MSTGLDWSAILAGIVLNQTSIVKIAPQNNIALTGKGDKMTDPKHNIGDTIYVPCTVREVHVIDDEVWYKVTLKEPYNQNFYNTMFLEQDIKSE